MNQAATNKVKTSKLSLDSHNVQPRKMKTTIQNSIHVTSAYK